MLYTTQDLAAIAQANGLHVSLLFDVARLASAHGHTHMRFKARVTDTGYWWEQTSN